MWYQQKENTIIVKVYVQPNAKRTEIVGLHEDSLKIRLASLPIDGRANEILLKFISQLFDVPIRQVTIKHGDKSRHKMITVMASKINPLNIIIPKRELT